VSRYGWMYDYVVAVHVASALVGFGVTFAYPVIQLTAERADRRALPFAMSSILAISRWVAVPATTLVGVTGAYLVSSGPYGLGDVWVALSVGLYIVVMAIGTGYLASAYRKAGSEARLTIDDTPPAEPVGLSPAYRRATRSISVVGPLVASMIIAIVVLMVVKPG
jgi:uncharacterized membrane protein